MSVARAAYSALVHALVPLGLARLAWRARREPGYRAHLAERFGRYGGVRDSQPVVWLHAVSVGETRAAEPLVRALLERYPQHRVLLTHTTPTGRRAGEALFGERVLQAYLPYDYPAAVARFLDRFAPELGVLLETEIWPNLVHACRARAIPLHLVNARLSERSFRGYTRVRALSREVFGALTAIAAQTEDDARRLRALGAREVHVTGNLKFDVAAAPALVELGLRWRADLGERRVLLAASTRDGEEALLLDALPHLPLDVLLLVVPRHPQRFDEVAALLEARTLAYGRRSAGLAVAADLRVLLGDSMGEMPAYYAACDAAFVGGSLLPFGGQNLIEGCAAGKPVLVGPHTYNFTEAARGAIEAGAAVRVETAEGLMRTAARLLQDPGALQRMGDRGIEFARAHQGATERVMRIIGFKPPQREG
jgi:3-deoxy-D-manno-octulosonic-acid transferase